MARMHARRKGKAGSKKPLSTTAPSWLKLKKDEIIALVLKLAKKGNQTSQIGLILRDSYGVPDIKIITGKSVSSILIDNKVYPEIPEDLQNLIKHAVQIKKHLDANKKDMVSKRGLQLTEAKIRRLAKYYKRTNKIDQDWKYDLERARLLVG
jgi:small subunit ribosomal protein S15